MFQKSSEVGVQWILKPVGSLGTAHLRLCGHGGQAIGGLGINLKVRRVDDSYERSTVTCGAVCVGS